MDTARPHPAGQQPPPADREELRNNPFAHPHDQEEQILVHFNGHFDGTFSLPNTVQEGGKWERDDHATAERATTKHNSRLHSQRISRQKSRRREFFGRHAKPGITVDTSFTRHRGNEPHQMFPQDAERGSGSSRRSGWFGLGRSSTRNKGLGITKGTPQPEITHQKKPSIDQNESITAISLSPGAKLWQDISPGDQRIPIGISVPTDSISDFSSYQAHRQRSGSDATLVTPSIIITPAAAMQSVWSPDTPFTESDYTPSVYSRHPFHSTNSNVPPVPALPAGVRKASEVPLDTGAHSDAEGVAGHTRHDTLDSAGTAFEEEYDDPKRKDRIMSSGTVFEEDETPLRERTVETSLAIDTSLVPTPRRSQGWWNVITTPFVTTPNTATWTPNGRSGDRTPDVPTLPLHYSKSKNASAFPAIHTGSATNSPSLQPSLPAAITTPDLSQIERSQMQANANNVGSNSSSVLNHPTQQTTSIPNRTVASPVIGTAALGTVLMPRQVGELSQPIDNIELQERRPLNGQTAPSMPQAYTSIPAAHLKSANSSPKPSNPPQSLPVFAPPPTFARKGSHFSYDNISRSSSPASTPDLKGPKKHRKVCDFMSIMPFGKRRHSKHHDAEKEKKKRRGKCFWGCCCCLILFILLVVLIPVVIVLTKKHNEQPTGTLPDQDVSNQWLNLPNYPPIPTGTLTIAQPEAVEEESGCVAPTTLWSCALPKELQESVKPNKPDQPNFKIQITYENGTSADLPGSQRTKRAANPVSVGAFIRSRLLQMRSAPSPSPAPPSKADMSFLGNTTDGNTAPFEGEDTPLFITFQDPMAGASRLVKRDDPSDPTNITAVIPPPMLASDGTAAPANLLPFPSAQPLRLFNRGKDDEHYGFYTYFDRSIFLKQINGTNRGGNPADTNGGSAKDAANLRCTYSETRFLVQIWTRSKASKPLLQRSASTESDVFKRPGTFPYPVTVTIDRHGGNAAKKNLYCYEMEDDGTIKNEASKRYFQFEDRAFGGNLVSGTQGRSSVTGLIDGGSGGCRCQWQNWLN